MVLVLLGDTAAAGHGFSGGERENEVQNQA